MPPELLRPALTAGVLIVIVALVTLPFQDPSSAEFVVTVLAALVGAAILALVTVLARRR